MHANTVKFIDRVDLKTKTYQTGITIPKGIKVLRPGELEDDWSPRPALPFSAVFVGSHSYASSYVMMSLVSGLKPAEDGRIYECSVRKSKKNECNHVIDRVEADPATADHALVMLGGFLEVTDPTPDFLPCYRQGQNGYLCHWVDLTDKTCNICGTKLDDKYNHPEHGMAWSFYYLTHRKPEGVELWAEGTRREIIPCHLVSMAPGTQVRLAARAHDGRREFMLKCRLENGVPVLAYSNLIRKVG